MNRTLEKRNAEIKEIASQVGFDLCGITSPDIIPEARERYVDWIKKGYQADMHYLDNIERRTNPKAVLQGAESIIMLAQNYYSYQEEAEENKIARYARGRDYHKVIAKKLKHMVLLLAHAYPNHIFKFFVDYGPFMERPYAEKAGLGFIGKNGNLITDKYGSWVFLSEIITTLPIGFDTPAERKCGSCTRCLDQCPTDAFVAPGMLDSAKCIAYQTIENKTSEIPEHIKEKQKGWVFGCDICQEVCPFNNKLRNKETAEADLYPRYVQLAKDDPALQSDEAFLEKFQGTPLMRAKRRGLKRNMDII